MWAEFDKFEKSKKKNFLIITEDCTFLSKSVSEQILKEIDLHKSELF